MSEANRPIGAKSLRFAEQNCVLPFYHPVGKTGIYTKSGVHVARQLEVIRKPELSHVKSLHAEQKAFLLS